MPILSIPRLVIARLRTAQSEHPRMFQFAFIGLLTIVLVVMSLQYISKASKPAYTGQQTRSAFLRWRSMILDVFDGVNVYVGLNEYPNPPVMAIVLRPFAELPPLLGAMAWFYAKVAMAVLAARWIFRLVQPPLLQPPNTNRMRQLCDRRLLKNLHVCRNHFMRFPIPPRLRQFCLHFLRPNGRPLAQ